MNSSVDRIKKKKRILLERYIKKSKRRHQPLFISDSDAIYAMDLDGSFIQLNQACEQIFGYNSEEFSSLSYMQVIEFGDLDRATMYFNKAVQGKLQNFDCQIIHKSGNIIDINITNYPILFREEVVGVYGVAKDITEIKQRNRKLRETEENYKLITDNSLDMITRFNSKGECLFVSPYAKDLTGYTPEEIKKLHINALIYKDDLQNVLKQRAMVKDGVNCQVIFRLVHKEGYLVWVESSCKGIMDSEGYLQEIISATRDISERKKAEEEVQLREETYREIVEHSPDAIIIAAGEKILFVNNTAVRLLGATTKSEIVEKSLMEFLYIEDHEIVKDRISEVEKGSTVEFVEERFVKLDGTFFEVEVKAIPTVFRNTPARHIIIRDIAERKKTQELILNSEKLSVAGQLAAGIAHEVRNPLTAIKGFLQLMNSSSGYNKTYLEIIDSEIDRIELILSELLLLAKPQDMRFKQKNLMKILGEVRTLIGTQAILYNIDIEIVNQTNILPILCDENQLKQVFINFLKNSIEAMPNGGKISIEAIKASDTINIRFQDQGCGIPKEHLDRIGQPFFTTKENGTGLGLMISFQIIENHGGKIDILSGENGTTIDVNLPCF